jgi:hypothetical protein
MAPYAHLHDPASHGLFGCGSAQQNKAYLLGILDVHPSFAMISKDFEEKGEKVVSKFPVEIICSPLVPEGAYWLRQADALYQVHE